MIIHRHKKLLNIARDGCYQSFMLIIKYVDYSGHDFIYLFVIIDATGQFNQINLLC